MKKILVVDDEPDIVLLTASRLRTHGYEVISASNGREGLEKASQEHPDLVLLDIIMPGIDGFAVLKELRGGQETHKIPVVMFTAKGQKSDVARAVSFGATDYIVKPFQASALLEKVREALGREENA